MWQNIYKGKIKLDKQNAKILKYFNNVCDDGSYKVFEFWVLCKELRQNKKALYENLHFLMLNEYIDIKYYDDDVICLCLLTKARMFEEQSAIKIYGLSVITRTMLISGIFNAIMAFLGAFVALMVIR